MNRFCNEIERKTDENNNNMTGNLEDIPQIIVLFKESNYFLTNESDSLFFSCL